MAKETWGGVVPLPRRLFLSSGAPICVDTFPRLPSTLVRQAQHLTLACSRSSAGYFEWRWLFAQVNTLFRIIHFTH